MRKERGEVDGAIATVLGIVALVFVIILLVIANMAFGPRYHVWQQGLEGQAELSRAEQSRQILVTQAKAEQEAASHRAAAIAIMGEMAQKYPEYRQQEFIGAFAEAMHNGRISQIIYVPTEAGIPILEAGRRPGK